MRNQMTKAEMVEMIAQMQAQIEALTKAQSEVKTSTKSKTKAAKPEKPEAPKVTVPVRKGKVVTFDGWLNYKVWSFNKPEMIRLAGEYDKESRSIVFPSAKAATEFCAGFVPTLSESQYEAEKAKIAENFEARKAAKAAASEAKPSKAKKADLIRKGKSGKGAAVGTPVKKPEWRTRAEKGEKPFANYSTYKEYWHATIGK